MENMKLEAQIKNRFRNGRAVGNDWIAVRVDGGRSGIVRLFASDEAACREFVALANARFALGAS